ncbi:MAG: hypothetical protein AAF719_01720 [Pseudomonadota bacterium]
MSFLLSQIFVLLLLAALFGAVLAYWWVSRRYEDVTDAHALLLGQTDGLARPTPGALTRADLDASVAGLSAKLGALPKADLSSVETRLTRIEASLGSGPAAPETDLGPLHERLGRLEAKLEGPNKELDALHARFGDFEDSLANTTAAIATNDGVDLGPLEDELRGMANKIDGLENPDLDPLAARLAEISAKLEALPEPNLHPLDLRLSRLEEAVRAINAPELDLGPVHAGLASLQLSLAEQDASPPVDLEPLHGHIAALEAKLSGVETRLETARKADIERIGTQLAALVASVSTLSTPDLAPLQDKIASLDAAIGRLTFPEADLRPLHQQLDALRAQIERPQQGLGAMQERIVAMDASLSALIGETRMQPGLEPIQKRLASLQDAIINARAPDLTPMINTVRAMDSRMDLGAIENRLTAIEYGLAAMHHMLRSRPEALPPPPSYERPASYRPPYDAPPAYQAPQRREIRGDEMGGYAGGSADRGGYDARADYAPRPAYDARPSTYVARGFDVGNGRAPAEPTPPASSARPARSADPINVARRPDDQANLLVEAAFGAPDNLEQISGVGPMLGELLNDVGVYYFWQIAEWTSEEVAWVDSLLMHFRGRIDRDNWVGQAGDLAAQPGAAARP